MNGAPRKIEILAPFNQAIELTKLILFRPFDIAKWLVIGFAAFLAGWFNSGGGGGINPWSFRGWNLSNWRPTFQYRSLNIEHAGFFVLALIAAIGIFVLAFVIVWVWVTSRGRFIFIDCIVRNRAAIAEPWREFHREGNSFFLFLVLVIMVSLAVMALLAAIVVVPLLLWRSYGTSNAPVFFVFLPIAIFGWVAFGILVNVVTYFMLPVMYARRCSPSQAARAVVQLILDEPAPFILFILFMIALWVAWIVAGCLVTCATCCIASLPYLGTVIVLPVPVLFRSFSLLFLRQLGPDWDVWAKFAVPTAMTPSPAQGVPPAAPATPVQEQPPAHRGLRPGGEQEIGRAHV